MEKRHAPLQAHRFGYKAMRGYARAGCAAAVVPALLMNVAEPRCRDPNGCSWATPMAAVGRLRPVVDRESRHLPGAPFSVPPIGPLVVMPSHGYVPRSSISQALRLRVIRHCVPITKGCRHMPPSRTIPPPSRLGDENMKLTRRAVLRWLPALALTTPLLSFGGVRGGGEPVSLVGFGGAGQHILRRLVELHPNSRELCYVETRVERGTATTFRTGAVGPAGESPPGPCVAVGRVGRGSGRAMFEFASVTGTPTRDVRGVLVIPFAFEGSYRERGIELAIRFVRHFPDSLVIDNERFLGRVDDESLLDVCERANAFAAKALARMVAGSASINMS